MIHKVETKWIEKLQFEVKTDAGVLSLDGPEAAGGMGKGLRSKPLMLASLSGCTGMDVSSLIKKMHLDVEEFTVNVEAELGEEHPKMYKYVKVIYNFKGDQLNKDKLKKAVDLSVTKYCGVIAMFKTFATVDIEVNFNK